MRYIDLQSWPRRQQYEHFSTYDHPHFGLCANVDLTTFYPAVRGRGFSITVGIVYALARAANAIPEFRYRLRPGAVVEHEAVHPSFTVLTEGELFSFCTADYLDDFATFAAGATERIAYVQAHPGLADEAGRDDYLFMTAIPWVSFTSFQHPMHLQPADSVPRFAWGKFFQDGESLRMPLDVQVHHALMDGVHVGRFYQQVQDYLHHPDLVLD